MEEVLSGSHSHIHFQGGIWVHQTVKHQRRLQWSLTFRQYIPERSGSHLPVQSVWFLWQTVSVSLNLTERHGWNVPVRKSECLRIRISFRELWSYLRLKRFPDQIHRSHHRHKLSGWPDDPAPWSAVAAKVLIYACSVHGKHLYWHQIYRSRFA